MISSYSSDAINFIKSNLPSIIKNYNDYSYIGCGGSVARGDAQEGSDIDLICIDSSIKTYKKEFLNLKFPIECHFIPVEYIKFNFNTFAIICNTEPYNLVYESNMRGAKFCNIISRKQDEMSVITSSWRELKKVIDAVDLHIKENCIVNSLREKIESLTFKTNVKELLNESLENLSTLDQLIVLLKVKMMTEKNVFSKVYWIDRYIEKMEKNEQDLMFNNIKINSDLLIKATNFVNKLMENISNLYSQIDCKACRDEMRNCNIYRCIYDYHQDSIKAKKNKFKYAEIFSIAKTLEYASSLYNHLNYSLDEIDSLRKVISIDNSLLIEIKRKIIEGLK